MAIQDLAMQNAPGLAETGSTRGAPKPARRLPVQRDWPLWAIITAQLGILFGVIAFWEIGARQGFIDGFFWSQPSAIARTFVIFFTEGDAWTDISFTFRSTILGFIIGTTTGSLVAAVSFRVRRATTLRSRTTSSVSNRCRSWPSHRSSSWCSGSGLSRRS